MTSYTIAELRHEINCAKATVRKAYKPHRGCRVYFGTPSLYIGEHVSLRVPFEVWQGTPHQSTTAPIVKDFHNIAI